MKGTDDIDVAPAVSDEQEEEDKVPESQEEAEARIIASAKESGSKLPEIIMLEPKIRIKSDRFIPNK